MKSNSEFVIEFGLDFGNHASLCPPRQLSLNEQNSRHTLNPGIRLHSTSLNPSRNPFSTGERPSTKEAGTLTVSFAESTNAKDWSVSSVSYRGITAVITPFTFSVELKGLGQALLWIISSVVKMICRKLH